MADLFMTAEERAYLRELAKKQMEYAMLPVMKQREERWYRLNDLKPEVPMIHIETWSFEDDIMPELKCTSEAAREIEANIYRNILNHELIDDDRVVPSWFGIGWDIGYELFDIKVEIEHSRDSQGRELGHQFKHPIRDLQNDLPRLKPTRLTVDKEKTGRWMGFVQEAIGDVLPVRITLPGPGIGLTQDVVHLMGMEAMIYALIDYPDALHSLMRRLADDFIRSARWQESEGLLVLNNNNSGVGQGTFGYTNDLPGASYNPDQGVLMRHVWGHMDSQETVGISPDMFGEFFFPYYLECAKQFGLLNYGCCEQVHPIWEKYISKLPGLRKVSISPWCDEEYMGQALNGSNVIYHRKPSPNFLGVGRELDEDAFKEHILKTIRCAQGCKLEITFRDVYTLSGNIGKPKRAVQIIRELLDKYWK